MKRAESITPSHPSTSLLNTELRYEIVGVSDHLDSSLLELCCDQGELSNSSPCVVIMDLEMMRVAAPHIGVEPCAGAKTECA